MWAGSLTVAVAGLHLGVLVDDAGAAAHLRRALAAHVVDDPDAPPNLAVRLRATGDRGAREKHVLYRDGAARLRTASAAHAVRALVAHLASHAAWAAADRVALAGEVLVRDGAAVLVGDASRPLLDRAARELAAAGWARPDDGLHPWLDLATGELDLDPAALVVDASALAEAAAPFAEPRTGAPPAPTGRARLVGWVPDAGVDVGSGALAVAHAASLVTGRGPASPVAVLDGLASALGGAVALPRPRDAADLLGMLPAR